MLWCFYLNVHILLMFSVCYFKTVINCWISQWIWSERCVCVGSVQPLDGATASCVCTVLLYCCTVPCVYFIILCVCVCMFSAVLSCDCVFDSAGGTRSSNLGSSRPSLSMETLRSWWPSPSSSSCSLVCVCVLIHNNLNMMIMMMKVMMIILHFICTAPFFKKNMISGWEIFYWKFFQ